MGPKAGLVFPFPGKINRVKSPSVCVCVCVVEAEFLVTPGSLPALISDNGAERDKAESHDKENKLDHHSASSPSLQLNPFIF